MARYLAGVKWNGLDSFLDELRLITSTMTDEADTIMRESAETAKREIAAAYPVKSRALRDGLTITPSRGTVIAGAELKQRAPHGWIFEHGTRDRQNLAGQNRGRMPGRAIFEPIAEAHRRRAVAAVVARLDAHGATRITGAPEAA